MCSVCKAPVATGDGFLQRGENRWMVTHAQGCPVDNARSAYAQSLMVRASKTLADRSSPRAHTRSAIAALGRLVATGWLKREDCEVTILASPASRKLNRWEIEDLLDRYLGGVTT